MVRAFNELNTIVLINIFINIYINNATIFLEML